MSNTRIHHEKGMTLIETIVAIALFASAITGPLVLAYQSIRASRDARNELIATHLASEGIEIIQSIRSNNSSVDTTITGDAWLGSDVETCIGAGSCTYVVDPSMQATGVGPIWVLSGTESPLKHCVSNCDTASRLYYDPTTGIYRQSTVTLPQQYIKSPYRRIVTLTRISSSEVLVTSEVYYARANGTEGKITLHSEIFNWFPSLI